jgi:Transglycosylase SLT domain
MGVAASEPVSPELVLVSPELRARVLEQMRAEAGEVVRPAETDGRAPAPEAAGARVRRGLLLLAAVPLLLLTGAWLGGTLRDRPRAASAASEVGTGQQVAPEAAAFAVSVRTPAAAASIRKRTPVAPGAKPGVGARKPRPTHATKPKLLSKELEPVPIPDAETESVRLLGPPPDPTPPPRRLTPAIGRELLAVAQARRVDWALLLADATTHSSSLHAITLPQLRSRARSLASAQAQASEREHVLAGYYRAIGLDALISGLAGAKPVLAARVLRDPRITVYAAGRDDVAAGRVNVRVLALLLFLARTQGQVTVANLVSGHQTAAGPQGSSARAYGLDVDITALASRPVRGQQQVGGRLDRALRTLQLLPAALRPAELISLLNVGSDSIALADHGNYVHISYAPVPKPTADGLSALWQSAGAHYGIPWQVLAAINKIETDNGQVTGTSSAGAIGWMQFLPATWREYATDGNGDGIANPRDPADAIYSAARFLRANGGDTNLPRALFAYNHASWYVKDVLAQARSLAG